MVDGRVEGARYCGARERRDRRGGRTLPAAGADCEDFEDFEAIEAPEQGSVDLLPKWDCYTMGYAPDGRQRFVRPEARSHVYNEAGDGLGAVFVDGEAVAALLGARSVSLA